MNLVNFINFISAAFVIDHFTSVSFRQISFVSIFCLFFCG